MSAPTIDDLPQDWWRIYLTGRVTVAGTGVENAIYEIAGTLGVIGPRERRATDVVRTVRRLVNKEGLPHWVDPAATTERVVRWLDKATSALQARHDLVHSIYYHMASDGDMLLMRRGTNSQSNGVVVDELAMRDLADRLAHLHRDGMLLAGDLMVDVGAGKKSPFPDYPDTRKWPREVPRQWAWPSPQAVQRWQREWQIAFKQPEGTPLPGWPHD